MSTKWPWRPSSGALAGRTFMSNVEYRQALAEVRMKEQAEEAARSCFERIIDARAEAVAAEEVATTARHRAERLMDRAVRDMCSRD